jgi:hypothetical protein
LGKKQVFWVVRVKDRYTGFLLNRKGELISDYAEFMEQNFKDYHFFSPETAYKNWQQYVIKNDLVVHFEE